MKNRSRITIFCMIFAVLAALFHTEPAGAHKLAPSLLQITQKDIGMIEVLWKESVFQKRNGRAEPVLPSFCTPVDKPSVEKSGSGISLRLIADCNGKSIQGSIIKINYTKNATTNVVLRIALSDDRVIQTILTPKKPAFQIPATQSLWQVMKNYLFLGIKHLFSGIDHMLFITGLMFLIRRTGLLLWTITAFTAGHSITLSLAALGFIHFPSAWIEFGISLSLFILAVEVAVRKQAEPDNSWIARRPWAMAIVFGLFHGLGFAAALGEIGLPETDIPAALFSFNVGIELAQCAWVVLIWIFMASFRRMSLPSFPWLRPMAIYAMGTCATYWCIERFVAILTIRL